MVAFKFETIPVTRRQFRHGACSGSILPSSIRLRCQLTDHFIMNLFSLTGHPSSFHRVHLAHLAIVRRRSPLPDVARRLMHFDVAQYRRCPHCLPGLITRGIPNDAPFHMIVAIIILERCAVSRTTGLFLPSVPHGPSQGPPSGDLIP
jgi:hypothetical protein